MVVAQLKKAVLPNETQRSLSNMQVRPGSLLIAHPAHNRSERKNQVIYITESNPHSTLGLVLNQVVSSLDLRGIMSEQGIHWNGDSRVYRGGYNNPNALVMLHTDEWYSTNTMQVEGTFSISSDRLMIEKLEMGNEPLWYRLFMGFEAWDASELEHQMRIRKPKWLLLAKPSQALLELSDKNLWQNAVAEYSQDVFANYI